MTFGFMRLLLLMVLQIVPLNVTPAQAGVYNLLKAMDSDLRRNDGNWQFQTF